MCGPNPVGAVRAASRSIIFAIGGTENETVRFTGSVSRSQRRLLHVKNKSFCVRMSEGNHCWQ
jgi:hypothetical protein